MVSPCANARFHIEPRPDKRAFTSPDVKAGLALELTRRLQIAGRILLRRDMKGVWRGTGLTFVFQCQLPCHGAMGSCHGTKDVRCCVP